MPFLITLHTNFFSSQNFLFQRWPQLLFLVHLLKFYLENNQIFSNIFSISIWLNKHGVIVCLSTTQFTNHARLIIKSYSFWKSDSSTHLNCWLLNGKRTNVSSIIRDVYNAWFHKFHRQSTWMCKITHGQIVKLVKKKKGIHNIHVRLPNANGGAKHEAWCMAEWRRQLSRNMWVAFTHLRTPE